MNWYPLLVGLHVALAVSLLAPSLLLPFLLRADATRPRGGLVRRLMVLQGSGGIVLGLAVAVSGAALLAILGAELLGKPWLLAALTLYAANLVMAFALARPNLRSLLGIDPAGEQARWQRLARRQRYLAYAMGGVVGLIGLLMSTKPELW